MQQDMIERTIMLPANRQRVWDAITVPAQINQWFGTRFEFGHLAAGEQLTVAWDEDVYPGTIEVVDPHTHFAFRWQTYRSGADENTPFDALPTTLVTFTLEDAPDGTKLTVRETGFAALPAERRNKAWEENTSGWLHEMNDLLAYLSQS